MKKKFFSKATALSLALFTVLSLIPMGTLSVFATETTANVDPTADNVVIDSVADWVYVSENCASETFEGKTVSLGADIAFGETAAPVLFATFSGTFYGNGHTVSGTKLVDGGKNLIATTVSGGIIDGGDGAEGSTAVMTISGFTVDLTATTKPANVALVAGIIQEGATVKNITASECDVVTTCSNEMGGTDSGIIVGVVKNTTAGVYSKISNCTVTSCNLTVKQQSGLILGSIGNPGYVEITNCTVDGESSITTYFAAAGAIIGKLNSNSYARVSNCTVASTVTITNSTIGSDYAEGLGMVIGQAGVDTDATKQNGDPVYPSDGGEVMIDNCIVGGTIKSNGISSTNNAAVGGIIGTIGIKGNSVISNNTVNVTLNTEKYIESNTRHEAYAYAGGIIGSSVSILLIENNTVNATITGGNNYMGGVIGYYKAAGTRALTISKCTVTGSITEKCTNGGGSPEMGGILGMADNNNSTGVSTIEKCYVDVDFTAEVQWPKIGGIAGCWGTKNATMKTTLTISDCYIGGDLFKSSGSGGVFNEYFANESTLNISNVIVASDVNNRCITQNNTGITPSVTDCYTTVSGDTTSGFAVINEALIDGLIKYDGNGKIAEIKDHFNCNLVQIAEDANGEYAIRIIGTSVFDSVNSAYMTVVFDMDSETKTVETACAPLDLLTAYTSYTESSDIDANEFGAEKFFAIVINGIPADDVTDMVFDVTLSVVLTEGGVEHTATFSGSVPAAALGA